MTSYPLRKALSSSNSSQSDLGVPILQISHDARCRGRFAPKIRSAFSGHGIHTTSSRRADPFPSPGLDQGLDPGIAETGRPPAAGSLDDLCECPSFSGEDGASAYPSPRAKTRRGEEDHATPRSSPEGG
jgi:hypothetical protein